MVDLRAKIEGWGFEGVVRWEEEVQDEGAALGGVSEGGGRVREEGRGKGDERQRRIGRGRP